MTELPPERSEEGRRWRRLLRPLLIASLVLVAFAIGVALGEALHDNPRPGGASTTFRTLPARPPR